MHVTSDPATYSTSMSTLISMTKLNRISRESLCSLLLTEPTEEEVVVVDVRDSDHIGGHIKSSRHVPSETLSYTTPELVQQLRSAEKVVFHCALSQQRGPSAALQYLRERERILGAETVQKDISSEEGKEGEQTADGKKKQEVYVLDGGFVKWQEKYGEDQRLTENYNKKLWEDGY